MDKELREIVTKEINAKFNAATETVLEAARELAEAKAHLAAVTKMLACDSARKHKFKDGGGLGGSFAETCSNCGWTHYA